MQVVCDRNSVDRDADDLFQMEQIFVEAHGELGATAAVRRIGESTLDTVRKVVSYEETLAESAKLRGDQYHYEIAWSRIIHGSTICRAMESRLVRWF